MALPVPTKLFLDLSQYAVQILRICTAKFAATSNAFQWPEPQLHCYTGQCINSPCGSSGWTDHKCWSIDQVSTPYSPDMNPIEEPFTEIKQYQANHLLFNTAMSSVSIKLMAFNSAHNTAKHIFSMQDTTNNTLTTCIHMILHVWSVCLVNGISNAWCNSACWTLNFHYPGTSFLSCSSIGAFCSLNSDSEIAPRSNRECKFLICCK